jgi:hypothetical protein
MQATEQETAQALHAFVTQRVGSGNAIWASEVAQFYLEHPVQYRHVLTGNKGALKRFVLQWNQYFEHGSFPENPCREYIQARSLLATPQEAPQLLLLYHN